MSGPSTEDHRAHDWTGCARKCSEQHTYVWGQCELAINPGPPPLLVAESSIAEDGNLSTKIRAATAEELAAHPSVRDLPATMLRGGDFDPPPDTDAKPVRFVLAPDEGITESIPHDRAEIERLTAELGELNQEFDRYRREAMAFARQADINAAERNGYKARAESAEARYDEVKAELVAAETGIEQTNERTLRQFADLRCRLDEAEDVIRDGELDERVIDGLADTARRLVEAAPAGGAMASEASSSRKTPA